MTEIIQMMIDRALDSGSITIDQKQMILAKAKQLGDDVDSVEIMLESIPVEEDANANSQPLAQISTESRRLRKDRCPNCGATLSGHVLQCPECGYVKK